MQCESVLGWHLCEWAKQEMECCACMSLICNVQTKESIGSSSVRKIEGLYVWSRSGEHGHLGSLKAASVLCVFQTLSFLVTI
jgi:hypothetical protein